MFRDTLAKVFSLVLGVLALSFIAPQQADAQYREAHTQKEKEHEVRMKGVMTAPPEGEFKKVSELTELPDFVPGLGTLYVHPEKLPTGPYLAYDRDGDLVSTLYMVPLKSLQEQKTFNFAAAPERVNQVDMRYNPGHPGLNEPHYHIILWHVPEQKAQMLSRTDR